MKNYWNIALFCSILIHTIGLVGLPSFNQSFKPPKKIDKKESINVITQQIDNIKRFEKKNKEVNLNNNEPKPLPYIEDLLTEFEDKNSFTQKEKPEIFNKNKDEVIFSNLLKNNDLQNNSAYTNYYKIIREKIRSNTYKNYNLKKNGDVMLSFLILSDGSLKNIECTSNSITDISLKRIALNSIQQSAPFPTFPSELKKYSQLRFNISIQFKN
ncbi:MAG: energy transducer TonB [Candidatus Omnitrophica bacterium]|nr:energy transducer TonB [Candidatus Omnitrophota bacterium]